MALQYNHNTVLSFYLPHHQKKGPILKEWFTFEKTIREAKAASIRHTCNIGFKGVSNATDLNGACRWERATAMRRM